MVKKGVKIIDLLTSGDPELKKLALEKMEEQGYIENKENELFRIYSNIKNSWNYNYQKDIKEEFMKISKEIIDFLMNFLFNKQPDKLKVKKIELITIKKYDINRITEPEQINTLRKRKYRLMLYFRRHITNKLPDYTQEIIRSTVGKIIDHLNKELEKFKKYKILTIKKMIE